MRKGYAKRGGAQYGRRTLRVRVKPTRYVLPEKTYTIRRGGKTITVHRPRQVVERKGYTYRRRDVGKPGRGPRLIPIVKGRLSKYGYSTSKPESARRRALDRAVKAYGAAKVWRMLHAQVILRKRTQPEKRAIFAADRDYIRDRYGGPVPREAIKAWMGMSPEERAARMPGG
ncbi:MAG: hypothetical protein QXD04_05585 [Candidatus Bathyarchaeia archaeon]